MINYRITVLIGYQYNPLDLVRSVVRSYKRTYRCYVALLYYE